MDPSSSSCIISALLVALQSFNRENTLSTAAEDGTHKEINDSTSPHELKTLNLGKPMLELSVLVVRRHHSTIEYSFFIYLFRLIS